MSKWIKVTDKLPELEIKNIKRGDTRYSKSGRVLCFCEQSSGKTMIKEGFLETSPYRDDAFWRIPGSIEKVTHWRPLPLPPNEFDYGVVIYKHRFSIKRSLDDYKETTLNKCIRIGLEHKYKTMAKDKLITELQVVYKDENNKLQCFCADLEEYTFEIKHKGDMMFTL